MSIKIERKGDKVTVETDYSGAEVVHSLIHEQSDLIGGMKSFGIDKVETRVVDSSDTLYAARSEFDRKYKEKYGENYLKP
jgi:hypothetical protein